jgi:hypothetical protein
MVSSSATSLLLPLNEIDTKTFKSIKMGNCTDPKTWTVQQADGKSWSLAIKRNATTFFTMINKNIDNKEVYVSVQQDKDGRHRFINL